jgi:hypothetical protein
MIVVGRTDDPTTCPGADAMVKQCTLCHHDVWIAPKTVIDTGLRAPLVCKQCLHAMAEEVRSERDG